MFTLVARAPVLVAEGGKVWEPGRRWKNVKQGMGTKRIL